MTRLPDGLTVSQGLKVTDKERPSMAVVVVMKVAPVTAGVCAFTVPHTADRVPPLLAGGFPNPAFLMDRVS